MNGMVKVEACESCRSAPCAVYCRADAAALCTACDADIHSANLLARRHHRVPIPPAPADGFVVRPSLNHYNNHVGGKAETFEFFLGEEKEGGDDDDNDDDAVSWLLRDPVKNSNQNDGDGLFFGEEVDGFLDLDEYNSGAENHSASQKKKQQQQQQSFFQYEASSEGGSSNLDYSASLCHSISLSSMEASIVSDTTMADISNSHLRPSKGTIDFFSGLPLQIPPQFTPMDREAKVLRYKEKKKTRKFEKTIRYASRKAYAETRPRIKGRFVKRADVEVEVDQFFSTTVMTDSSYPIVPSF